jgi:excisionase family DNA binding protein
MGAKQIMSSGENKWLSLKQAAEMLGIHPTTLRRWADNGDIPVYVTPGGHRRFLESDVQTMIDSRLVSHSEGTEEIWATTALTTTKQRLHGDYPGLKWLNSFNDEQRQEQRLLGQQMLDLIMHHMTLPEDDESLLRQAESIAIRYAQSCMNVGLTVDQSLEIAIFFRDSITESALQLPQVVNFDDETRLRFMRKINQVLNLLQLTLVKYYSQQD